MSTWCETAFTNFFLHDIHLSFDTNTIPCPKYLPFHLSNLILRQIRFHCFYYGYYLFVFAFIHWHDHFAILCQTWISFIHDIYVAVQYCNELFLAWSKYQGLRRLTNKDNIPPTSVHQLLKLRWLTRGRWICRTWKWRTTKNNDWKLQHLENDGPNRRPGICKTWKMTDLT